MDERYFNSLGEPVNSLGQLICGYDRGPGLSLCLLPKGYKTGVFLGCYIHPGGNTTALNGGFPQIDTGDTDPREKSVWDMGVVTNSAGDTAESSQVINHIPSTSPVGSGLGSALEPTTINPKSFAPNIRSPRLRELVDHEESTGNLDDMDSLVALLRGTIAYQCQFLGIGLDFNEEGMPVIDADSVLALDISSKNESQLFYNVSRLTEIIKRKYEITVLSQSLFTHERVIGYIGEITSVIDAVLRDTCEQCGHEHNLRTKVLDALVKIGDI